MNKKTDKTQKTHPQTSIEVKYHPDGKVWSKRNYVNNIEYEVVSGWYSRGGKQWESAWKGDKRHGLDGQWRQNGTKNSQTMWRDDEKNGTNTHWYESGPKYSETTWKNDEKHGIETAWYAEGTKRWEKYYFHDEEIASLVWREGYNVDTINSPTIDSTKEPIGKPSKITSKPKSARKNS